MEGDYLSSSQFFLPDQSNLWKQADFPRNANYPSSFPFSFGASSSSSNAYYQPLDLPVSNSSVSFLNQPVAAQAPFSDHLPIELPTSGRTLKEEPVALVNAKQYNRIIKRRIARGRLESRLKGGVRPKYLHESRHAHAVNRKRGGNGRFFKKVDSNSKEDIDSDDDG